jgi:Right handed beta helix region/PKD domain
LLTLSFSGCGGGGGGSDGGSNPPPPVVYSGNQDAAVVTADSARTLAAGAVGSSAASVLIAGIKIQQQPAPTSGAVALAPRLNRYLRGALQRVLARATSRPRIAAGFNVQETDDCDVSGTVTFSGTLSDTTGTGTLSVAFAACNLGSGVLNGLATLRIDANDISTGFPTDSTTTFSALQVKTLTTVNLGGFQSQVATQDVTASGALRSQVTIATNHELLSGNLVTRDNASGKLQKVDNLALVIDYNNLFFPSAFNLAVSSGRVFDDVAGYVDASTPTTTWFFATVDQIFPTSGGALILTGALNAQVSVSPVSAGLAKVEVDVDADGVFELSSTMPWTAMKPPAANTAPVASAGANQNVPKGIAVTLDGSGSTDADFDFLKFQWTLAQKPSGSAAQLSGATTVHPALTPDRAGGYLINLAVTDGKLSSPVASITLTAFNTAPVAKVDPVFVGYDGIPLVLDASQSSDGNNDPLTFNWTFTSKPAGSTAALSGAGSATPSFTPDAIGIYRLGTTVNDGTVDSQPVSVVVYAVTKVALTPQRQVPSDHPTIQAAIDAAAPGDVVAVAPGTYTGNLRFNGKNVTLQSTDGPSRTIIKGVADTAVDIGPNGAIIGFTIRDGIASFGGGMAVHGTGTVIKNNVFTANTQTVGGFGAAIAGNTASPVIDANIFRDNSCQNDNQFPTGIITFVNSSSPTISNNIIENNPCRAINMTLPAFNAPQVFNNTIVANRTGILVNRFMSTSQVYRNNVIVGNDLGFDVSGGTDADNPVWENNLVFGNGTNYSNTADKTGVAGNISADPLFVDQAGGLYYPNAGSPLIDAGTGTGAPTPDFFGRTRPIDGNGDGSQPWDIGAFEFQP